MLKMATRQMKTKYLKHLGPAYIQQVQSHRGLKPQPRRLARTKLGCDVPTITDEKYTSHACCRSSQNNVELILLAQSLRDRHELHLLLLLQVVQL